MSRTIKFFFQQEFWIINSIFWRQKRSMKKSRIFIGQWHVSSIIYCINYYTFTSSSTHSSQCYHIPISDSSAKITILLSNDHSWKKRVSRNIISWFSLLNKKNWDFNDFPLLRVCVCEQLNVPENWSTLKLKNLQNKISAKNNFDHAIQIIPVIIRQNKLFLMNKN